jgi:hypothetical protein
MTVVYSPCQTWRYLLSRDFPEGEGTLNFLMLNPSTADAVRNDPTVRRCIGYAQRWGYATLLVTNIFAFRATLPRVLAAAPDPVGPENDAYIVQTARTAERVVIAWGIHGRLHDRDRCVIELLRDIPLLHLGLTREGHPRHPLYVRGDADCAPFARTSPRVR